MGTVWFSKYDYVITRTGRGIKKFTSDRHEGRIIGMLEEEGKKYFLTCNSEGYKLFCYTEDDMKRLDLRFKKQRDIKNKILSGEKLTKEKREEIKELAKKQASEIYCRQIYYMPVAIVDDKYISVFDGITEYRIGETSYKPVVLGEGGHYVYNSIDLARDAYRYYEKVLLEDKEIVVMKVECEDYCRCVFKGGPYFGVWRYIFERVTPLEVVV